MAQETQEDAVALLLEQHETVRNLLVAVERETGDARLEVFQPLVRLLRDPPDGRGDGDLPRNSFDR